MTSWFFWPEAGPWDPYGTEGLSPDHVKVVAGAAGGPKWLILGHLDRLLFGSWFRGRRQPLVSARIVYRQLALCRRFVCGPDRSYRTGWKTAYIHQAYAREPTPREISEKSLAIIDHTLGAAGPREVLDHPVNRLSLVTVRSLPHPVV